MICLRRTLTVIVLLLAPAQFCVTARGQKTSSNNKEKTAVSDPKSKHTKTSAYPQDEEESQPEELSPFSRYGYAYSLGQTEIGASGLFSIFDAYTLRKKEFRAGFFASRFNRAPGDLHITQVPLQFSVGLSDHLELFFGTNVHQRVRVGNLSELSGSILRSSLSSASVDPRSILANNSRGFFPLPGLQVSGALAGGILPGLPTGQSQQVFDTVLNRQKDAFSQASFPNDLPFLGRNGSSYGDSIIGAKYRFIDFTPGAVFSQTGILGYVKLPSTKASRLLAGGDSSLFDGSGSGTTDFAIYLMNSSYIPQPGALRSKSAGQQKNVAPTDIIDTINVHVNIGYVRNSDPKINGVKIIDRKDNLVTGVGMDSMLNRYVQAIGEFKYTRLIGSGTANLGETNPGDVSAGFRFYPLGMPKQVSVCDKKKVSNDLFLSVGAAYKYSFDFGSIQGAIGNHHGFVFSLTMGRSNNLPKLDTCDTKSVGSCEESERERPLTIESLTIDRMAVKRGEEIKLTAQVKNRFKQGIQYKWEFPNGEVKTTTTPETTFTVSKLRAGKGYHIKLTAFYKVKDVPCPNKIKEAIFDVTNTPPTLELSPAVVGPISANVPQDITLTASVTDPDNDPLSLSWRVPAEITLTGSESDATRSFSSSNLRAGQRYSVGVVASDGEASVEKASEIKVNNPPTVTLQMSPSVVGNNPVKPGTLITFRANGNDLDGDKLSYDWHISANSKDGAPLPAPSLQGNPADAARTLISEGLAAGVYTARVTASDGIDTSSPAELTFTIEEDIVNGPSIFFDFDKYKLTGKSKTAASARRVLLEQAQWLLEDANRQVIIRVEGNADRRGIVSYNLRLGCRRACEAKRFLVSKGIEENRIRIIISYGKSRASQDPARYVYDRRVDLIYIRVDKSPSSVDGEVCTCQMRR